MSNLASENVTVFPSVKRSGDYLVDSRCMNESNLTRIIKSVTDNNSYIINSESFSSGYTIEFVIQGYYFKVTNYIPSGGANIYAEIYITDSELNGQDEETEYEETEYTGLNFVTEGDLDDTTGHYNLKLFNYNESVYSIAEESYRKFKDTSIEGIRVIDCGTI